MFAEPVVPCQTLCSMLDADHCIVFFFQLDRLVSLLMLMNLPIYGHLLIAHVGVAKSALLAVTKYVSPIAVNNVGAAD